MLQLYLPGTTLVVFDKRMSKLALVFELVISELLGVEKMLAKSVIFTPNSLFNAQLGVTEMRKVSQCSNTNESVAVKVNSVSLGGVLLSLHALKKNKTK
jgi:hypothetical protein